MTNEEFIQSIALEGEEWRDVVGWEGLYYISSFGRVFCAKQSTHKPTIIKPYLVRQRKKTYQAVKLNLAPIREQWFVHRLVASAFIPNPESYDCIDHIDGNELNNHVSNLRWCTRSMNNRNPIAIQRESNSHMGKMNAAQNKTVVQLQNERLVKVYRSIADVEKEGFIRTCVSRVCSGKLSQHKGFQWMYLSDYESLINKSKNSLPAPITADYPQ
jgi:hypothetical protein